MSKKFFILAIVAVTLAMGSVMAETTIQQIQSPIYTDDIGRSHFLGKGGYSSVRQTQMNQVQADFVNDAVNNYSAKKDEIKESIETVNSDINTSKDMVETDITNVIKERTDIPVSSKTKASFSADNRTMDPSATFGRGATYLPSSGVNESKTLYTDELGRLHFFGKGNLIKE